MEILAVASGALIALMLVANSTLQQALGPASALVSVHAVGLAVALPLALLIRWPGRRPGVAKWPLFVGGFVGVVLLLINNRTIPVLGTGLVVALGIVGQLAASTVVDHFGLFGLPQRRVGLRQLGGLAVAGTGAWLMVWVGPA